MTSDGARAHALVLAGGVDRTHPVAQADSVAAKPFARVAGTAMVERVVAALLASDRITHVTLSLSRDAVTTAHLTELPAHIRAGSVSLREPGPSRAASALDGAAVAPGDQPLLIVTADHPLLTAAMVDDVLAGAQRAACDFAVAMNQVQILAQRYPEVRCSRLRMRDGVYSGCNLYAMMRPAGSRAVTFWRELEQSRKAPHRIAARLGPASLVGYLLRRWTLAQALERLSAQIGCRVAPVLLEQPEAAIDVDTPADLALVRRIARQGPGPQDTAAK
ncbi:hypothetical protein CKO28_20260 [Rhodovibrio sodomensis]|uniref:MobA-like NTP transferase domain-containing protein n=1 Tax=Rhodovibrio sodomensis TaxID=1088 RepID=A0ABS1DK46_9PROT|nr:nucleotidyltransferase family protein [Rhodovibrio sodomensis]MBK1670361.1 hypothetical protein [Rhodovibrio sodomensis]